MCCPSPASRSCSSPLGDHCSESKPAGSFRAGTVRAAFGTSISCGSTSGSSKEGCWVESLWEPHALFWSFWAPGQNPFPHPSTQEAQAALSLQPFPPSSQPITLTSRFCPARHPPSDSSTCVPLIGTLRLHQATSIIGITFPSRPQLYHTDTLPLSTEGNVLGFWGPGGPLCSFHNGCDC